MSAATTIDVDHVTKRFGETVAVSELTFAVSPARVTGFLGPNGAGKSTTLRMLLGLDRPSSGHALIHGRPYRELDRPLESVGALLDAGWVHPNRSGRDHLRWLARSNSLPAARVDAVLEDVGLTDAGERRAGAYSLGMRQRLGIAAALLGDPQTLIFDEPLNGLDPAGIAWLRGLLHRLADEGRTVFFSSHMLAEMSVVASHVVVIGRGQLISQGPMHELVDRVARPSVRVRSPQLEELRRLLVATGMTVQVDVDALVVADQTPDRIGEIAGHHGIELRELSPQRASLEDAFLRLTDQSVEFRSPPEAPGQTDGSAAS
jgi:ABC-2 type transport system ATP-binding protein